MASQKFTICNFVLFLLAGTVAGRAEQVTVPLRPVQFVTCWKDSTFRGRDIADNDYREGFFHGPDGPFSRYEGREVTLTYERTGGAFRGRIVARGLKPNFSYQMKLVGRPTREFGAAGDDATNERIGRTGRWWRKGPWEGNTYDWGYEHDRDDPQSILVSYLIFDYFVTDRYGNATKDFAAVHSIHAFWENRTTMSAGGCGVDGTARRPFPTDAPSYGGYGAGGDARPYDSPSYGYSYSYSYPGTRKVTPHHVSARRSTGYGYDKDYPDSTVGIRLEIERFEEGTMVLPPGDYYCRFLLTEESFHQRGVGGYWQSAMIADHIRFSIRDYVAPPVITFPRNGDTVGPRFVLKGQAEPTEIIKVYSDEAETPLATARSGADGRWAASLRLPPGPHRLHAVAHCGARQSEAGKAVAVVVEIPGTYGCQVSR
jgi:hypothetical protein